MTLHHTVMLDEAVSALSVQSSGVYIDATLGGGGHSREIIGQLGKDNTFLGIDADQTALDVFMETGLSATDAEIILERDNFKNIEAITEHYDLQNIRGILADLGWRMDQFVDGGKGFSFKSDEPLHMTYGDPKDYPFTAHDLVNEWDEEDIANVLYGYGEERKARVIARAITAARTEAPIESAAQLADIVEQSVGKRGKSRIHPATKTFQALRIAVNDEFEVLEQFITSAFDLLEPGGRLVIITFHSLEDRIVKHRFRSLTEDGVGTLLTKKPVVAGETEISHNPRARSAKMRVIEKT